MRTIAEIRSENLKKLVEEVGSAEAVASRSDTSAVYLSQLRNGAIDRKTGLPRVMGSATARKLEAGCGKPKGWMDNDNRPRSYREDRISHAIQVMEGMDDWQLDQAIKIVDTIAEPMPRQGNAAK